MKSVLELLATIMSIPHIDIATKTRAGFIKNKLERRDPFAFILGLAR